MTRTFILVHGAWHGGWCWSRLVGFLALHGRVIAPDLPGSGASSKPAGEVTLADCTKAIVDIIDTVSERDRIVLVGHSAGGAVITAAAEQRPERIERLVYVTAYALQNGESLLKASSTDKESQLSKQMQMSKDKKTITLKSAEGARPVLYNDLEDRDFRYCFWRLTPQSSAVFREPVATTPERWGRIPKTYIICTKDNAIGPAAQRQMALQFCGCKLVPYSEAVSLVTAPTPVNLALELNTGHSPMVNKPDQLARLIVVGLEGGKMMASL
ncbi:Alpha/beta hydrolase fold-1 [Hyaloraphidium curvatum]|nr:Alpha/beta hydrolase fold-1 [Hyaloraphidium curvatum]